MSTPIWMQGEGKDGVSHFMILGSTRKGKSALLQAEALRRGITYEELERSLEPTQEEKELARIRQEEEDRRDAARLDAVRRAYWDNTEKSDSDLHALHDALAGADVVPEPTEEQQRRLFMMLPASVLGQGIAWGFSDTEVRDRIYEFVSENLDAVTRVISASRTDDS